MAKKSIMLTGGASVGKSSIYTMLTKRGFEPAMIDMTREARPGEVQGVDANFVSLAEFFGNLAAGRYFDTEDEALYIGNYYGTPTSWIDRIESDGVPIVGTPGNILGLGRLATALEERGTRDRMLWVNLSAPLDVRLERILPRTPDPEKLALRLGEDVYPSYDFVPEADMPSLSTDVEFFSTVVDQILERV